jgi:hypothetical protein
MFYHDWRHSPVYKMLIDKGVKITDGTLIWFTDASHGDCDESRSTCCYLGFYQGGIIDMSSFVAQPIPHSTAESETIAISVGAMACAYARMGIADILFDDADKPWTIPLISDSSAAIAMNSSNKPTKRNRHIDRRYFYGRQEYLASKLEFHHIDADHSLADLATKNLTAEEAAYKLSIVECTVTDHQIGTKATYEHTRSKKGDENLANDELLIVPEKLTERTNDSAHATVLHMYRAVDNAAALTHEELAQNRQNDMQGRLYGQSLPDRLHATESDLWHTRHASRDDLQDMQGDKDRVLVLRN